MNTSRRAYLVYGAAAVLAALCMALLRGVFSAPDGKTAAGIFSDCFLVPGIVLTGLGGLSYAASKGAYDALGYAFSRFSLHSLFATRKIYQEPETLYEYKKQRDEKGRSWSPAMVWCGLGSLLFSGLFLLLYAVL